MKKIQGSAGTQKAAASRAPTTAPDTLNSKQFASLQDLLSEGEIEGSATASKAGLVKGTPAYNNAFLKDIFLDDTPILQDTASNSNPTDADFNFKNVEFDVRFGTSSQQHIVGIESSQSIVSVGVDITKSGGGHVKQITNTNIDAAKVTITFPQIQLLKKNGDIKGSEVEIGIQIQYQGGGFNAVITNKIKGRTADAYQKEYRVSFDRDKIEQGTAFPVDIKVIRLTDDSTSSKLVDKFQWSTLGLIVDDKQRYLDCAYTNIRIDSEQFSNIPKRAFRIRGVKVRIPGAGASNSGTPTVDINTGRIVYPTGYIFNGVMGAATWCSCPSMILLDLLTTERYGFGTHITDPNLDLFSFVKASRYANELVSDGDGGLEARFSCNVCLQGSMDAYKLINELSGVMRSFPIWMNGNVTVTQDAPTDPSYLFSLANVGESGFSYSGTSLKQRHSVISVSYFNMDSRDMDIEVVEDAAAIAKLGFVKKQVKAFACTSRGQAIRLGKAILFSEQNESEIVTFTTSLDAGAIVRPGNVIAINDPVRADRRRSGRINVATTTTITVDDTLDLDTFTGTDRKCSVLLPDGSLETKDVTSIVDNVITLGSALSAAPNANSIWLIQSSNLEAQLFRVISVEEQDRIQYTINALTYIPDKYNNIEQGLSLTPRPISLLNEPKDPPSNLQAEERIVVINALAVSKLIISWVGVAGVNQYLVQYRFDDTNWVSEVVFRTDYEILNTEEGLYEIKVFSYNASLEISKESSDIEFNARGKTEPPGDVQNLSIEPVNNKLVRLKWDRSIDADVIHGGRVYIRHSNLTDGSGTFQNSVNLIEAVPGNSTDAIVPSLDGEYILKFQDDNGNFSLNETSIIQELPDLIDQVTVLTQREDLLGTPFSGTKTNTKFDNTASALQLLDTSINKTGTYSQSGTTVTISIASHGVVVGQVLNITYESGDAVSGKFTVQSGGFGTDAFTVTASNSATNSGNVTVVSSLTGEYSFASTVDLGGVFSLDLKRTLQVVGFNTGTDIETLIPGLPGILFDEYALDGNFDGTAANETDCQLQVATSQTASGSFSSFSTFASGTYKARRFIFKLILETTNSAQNLNVQQAGFIGLFQSRVEQKYQTGGSVSTLPQDSGTSANGLDVTFGSPFFVGTSSTQGGANAFKPSLGVLILGVSAGEYFVIKTDSNGNFLNAAGQDVTGTGFNIQILNSSNNPVNKKFTFQAVGYGKGV